LPWQKAEEGRQHSCIQSQELRRNLFLEVFTKVIHPKYYKNLKKVAHQSYLGRQKMDWFLAD
jgi:hypothetical protein